MREGVVRGGGIGLALAYAAAIGWLYVRMSARSVDPLAERLTAGAERETFADRPAPGREPVADRTAARR